MRLPYYWSVIDHIPFALSPRSVLIPPMDLPPLPLCVSLSLSTYLSLFAFVVVFLFLSRFSFFKSLSLSLSLCLSFSFFILLFLSRILSLSHYLFWLKAIECPNHRLL